MTKFTAIKIGEKLRTKSQRNARKITENLFKAIKNENTTGKVLWVVEKLFWMIVYLTGIILTVLTCIDLYQDYQNHPTSTTTELIQFDSITPQDITVCLPFFNTEKLIDFYLNYDYMSVTNPCKEMPNKTQPFTLAEKIESIFSHTKSWKEAQEMVWEPPLLYVAQQYLAAIYEAEFLRANDNEYLIADMLSGAATDNTSEAIVNHLISKMSEWNVTIKEFKKTFGHKFREFLPMNFTLISDGELNEIDSVHNIIKDVAFITKNQVCYKIGLSHIALDASTDFVIIINERNLRCYLDYDLFSDIIPLIDYLYRPICTPEKFYGPVTVDFSGKERAGSVQYEYDEMFIVHSNRYTLFSMKPVMKYQYEPVVKGKRVCSADETLEACQDECRDEIIQELCNCAPNIAAIEPDFETIEKRECLFENYADCLLNYTSAKDHDGCMNECREWCTHWQYNVSKSVHKYYSVTQIDVPLTKYRFSYHHFVIVFSLSKFNYQQITEFSLYTAEDIVGNIGGAFGFWLGLDIIFIVYTTLTVPILLLLKKYFRTKNIVEQKSVNSHMAENNQPNGGYGLISTVMNELKLQLSQIKDMNFAELARWIIQKLAWGSLFVIGAGFTVKQYVELCQGYGKGGTKSVTNVMINKSISLPPSAFCIPAGQKFLPLIYDCIIYDGLDQMPCYLSGRDINITNLLASSETWPPSLILQSLSFSEGIFLFSQGKYNSYVVNDDDYNFLLNVTQSILEKYSLTNDILFNRAAHELVKLKNITATCFRASENKSVSMLPSQVTIESAPRDIDSVSSLCIHFPLETFEFYDENDYCSVSFRDVEMEPEHCVKISNKPIYWALKSPTSLDYAVDLALSGSQGQNVVFRYTTIYQYESNCVPDMLPADCLTKCRNENMTKTLINCTKPTKTCYQNIVDGDDYGCYCSLSTPDFSYCFNSDFIETEAACKKECEKQMCAQYTYKIDNEYIGFTEDSGDRQELNIRVRNFIYPLIREVPVMTSGEFLSASGGLLGFYLGLDATFLVSIIVTPLMFLLGAYLKKSSSRTVSDRNITMANASSPIGNYYLNYLGNLLGVNSKWKNRVRLDRLLERLLWSVIYIIFGIMTFILCIDFVRRFRDNPIDSNSDFNREEELTIPVTLCVSLSTSELGELYDDEIPSSHQSYLFLKNNPFTRQQISVTDIWDATLLRIAHRYLINIERYKVLEDAGLAEIWKSLSKENMENYEKSIMSLLGSQLERESISHCQLLQKFGQELQRYYWINIIKHTKASNGSSVCEKIAVNQTSFVSDTKICFMLSKNLISFLSYRDYVTIQIDKSRLFKIKWTEPLAYQSITLDLLGSTTGSIYSDFGKNFSLGEENTIGIKIGDVVQMLPEVGGVSRCSETTTQAECKDNCKRMAIEQQCNCSLHSGITETHSTLNSNVCTWKRYEECLPDFSSQNALDCIRRCPISCKFIRYEVGVFGNRTIKNKCRGSYTLRASNFFYQISVETVKWSFFSFVAELGGLLGIFLGIDILWIINSLFVIVRWMTGRSSITAGNAEDKTPSNNAKKIKLKTPNSSRKSRNAVQPILEENSM